MNKKFCLDKVYNITAYMKYHPGGVDELMRGAGINATNLFNEVNNEKKHFLKLLTQKLINY